MSTHHDSGVEALVDRLKELAGQLATRRTHFSLFHRSGGWELVVFVRPIEDPEVEVRESDDVDPYGVIRAASPDLADVLATGISICESVTRNLAVPA